MIVDSSLKLKLLVLMAFQEAIVRVLTDAGATRTVAGDGSKITISSSALPGASVELHGFGLAIDQGTGGVSGNVGSFSIVETASGERLDGLLPLYVLAAAMYSTALAGFGAVNALNYAAFYQLLMPFAFYQLLYTGTNRGEVVEGFQGPDEVKLRGGNDTFIMGPGGDKANGGAGNDKIDASLLDSGVRADLDRGIVRVNDTGAVNRLKQFENMDGTAFNDVLKGDENSNVLKGLDGNDKLFGGDGNDGLEGGKGQDTLVGGKGSDTMTGGKGRDRFVINEEDYVVLDEDTITDFEDDIDTIDFRGFGFSSADDALAFAEDIGGGVRFFLPNGLTLTVIGNVTTATIANDIDIGL